MRRHITTIVLLLVAVALGIYLWRDRDTVTSGERQRRENNVFTAWRRDELTRIEIQHEGETIVLLKEAAKDKDKGAENWRMTSPSNERVDPAAVERLMTTLEFATRTRKVTGDANLGLNSPRARGSLTMGTLVLHFALGSASPRPEGSSYFKVEGDASGPFVVSKELTEALLARADTYRDRTVIPYLSLDMAHFQVRHGTTASGGGFAVSRTDDRSFKVDGANLLASRGALDKVWGALAEMRAEAFPKNADAERLTANVRMTITMTAKEPGKPLGELVVGDACPDHPNDVVVLRTQPTRVAACAPKGALETLLAITPDLLVDRHPFSFRHDEIEELRLETVGGALDAGPESPTVVEVARRGTGFHQREPEDRELTKDEADAVTDLLTRIEHTDASEAHPGTSAPRPFEAVAKARVRTGAYDEVVEVGPITKESVVLRRVRDDARLTVTAPAARRLIPRRTTTKPHLLLHGETRPVKRVVLRCGTSQELVDEGGGLKLVEPKGYETDGAITQLVDAILRGKVVAWVADNAEESFGLSAEGCRIVMAFQDGNNPLTIRLGSATEGGVYGQVDGRADVFVASSAFVEMAKRIYVSRAALRADPTQIESVKMTVGGKPVTLRENAKERVGALFPDRVATIGNNDIDKPDLELTITMSEGGPPKRITCSKPDGVWRKCATPSVKAVFELATSLVDGLQVSTDAR